MKRKKTVKYYFKSLCIYTFSVLCILPILMMSIYSLFGVDGKIGMGQYLSSLFLSEDFFLGYWNSFKYTVLIILFNTPLSLMGGYAISRFKWKGRGILLWFYIVLMLLPFQATLVPQYITLRWMNLINNPMAVVLPNIFTTFGSVLMAQHMRGLDREILEAGRLDGFSEGRLFLKIAVPMCKPLIFGLTVLSFINYWSMIEHPLVFLSDIIHMPLSVTLNQSSKFKATAYAMGVLFSLLPLLLYLLTFEDLVYGIGLTGVTRGGKDKGIAGGTVTNRKRYTHYVIWYIIFMLVCTVVTEKVLMIKRPIVEVVNAVSKDIKSDFSDRQSDSLGFYTYVIPDVSVHQVGNDYYVYTVEREKSVRGKLQLIKTSVTIMARNEMEVAVSGSISKQDKIVVYSNQDLNEGSYVNIYNGEKENKNSNKGLEILVPRECNVIGLLVGNKSLTAEFDFNQQIFEDKVILSVNTTEGRVDSFLLKRFVRLLKPYDVDINMLETQAMDYSQISAISNEVKGLKKLLAYIVILILTAYWLYCITRLGIKRGKLILRSYYFFEALKQYADVILEKAVLVALILFTNLWSLKNIVDYKFYVSVTGIEESMLLKNKLQEQLNHYGFIGSVGKQVIKELDNVKLQLFISLMIAVILLLLGLFVIKKVLKHYLTKADNIKLQIPS